MHKEAKFGKGLYNGRFTGYLVSELLYALWMQDHDSNAWSAENAKASLLQHKHLKLSLSSHHKQRYPLRKVSLTRPKFRQDIWTAPCCSRSPPFTHRAVPTDSCAITEICKMWHFRSNHDEASVPVSETTRTSRRQTCSYNLHWWIQFKQLKAVTWQDGEDGSKGVEFESVDDVSKVADLDRHKDSTSGQEQDVQGFSHDAQPQDSWRRGDVHSEVVWKLTRDLNFTCLLNLM